MLAVFVASWVPATAAAGDATTESAPARAQVVLVGDAGRGDALGAVLAELLVRQDVTPEFDRRERFRTSALLAENAGDARVWVFVTLHGSRTARLYFRGPYGNRFLLRELSLKNGLDELGRELIAQVVETSTLALLRSEAGLSREEAQRDLSLRGELRDDEEAAPLPAPPPQPSRAARTRASRTDGSLRYEIAGRLAEKWTGPDLGVDTALGLETGLSLRPSRSVLVRGRVVFEQGLGQAIETSGAAADTRTTSVRAGLDLGTTSGPHGFVGGASGGVDLVRLSPRKTDDASLAPAGAVTVETPLVRLDARYELTLGSFRATVGVLCDVALEGTHYDVRRGDERTRVAEPWALRPGASLTVGWAPPL